MKRTFNLTTYSEDLDRYRDRDDLIRALVGFDGVELMHCGPDSRGIVPRERIVGVHLCYYPYWYDFYTGDLAACRRNLGSMDAVRAVYGGGTPDALIKTFMQDIAQARAEGAEYVVFHVADCSDEELFTLTYRHSSLEIVTAAVDLLNRLFPLLSGVRYRNKGIMLDTGHLMHTNLSIRTQEEGLAYIRRCIEEQGEEVRRAIRGIHLHQSLTGTYMAQVAAHPPLLSDDPDRRREQVYTHAFRCDEHRPFTFPGVREFIRWIDPDYLTFEFISRSRKEHETMLSEQLSALREG